MKPSKGMPGCLAAVALLAALLGCNQDPASPPADGDGAMKDTLRLVKTSLTFVRVDSILYSYPDPDYPARLRTTRSAPDILDTLRAPVGRLEKVPQPARPPLTVEGKGTFYDTLDPRPGSPNPEIIMTTRDSTVLRYDTLRLPLDPARLGAAARAGRPEFRGDSALHAALAAVTEGLEEYLPIPVFAFPGDSTVVRLSGNPPFVGLATMIHGKAYWSDTFNDYALGPLPLPEPPEEPYFHRPSLRIRAGREHRDTTYRFSILARNRFGGETSLEVELRVKPYTGLIRSAHFANMLIAAASRDDTLALDSLFQYPLDPAIKNAQGVTPLMAAARYGKGPTLEFLLSRESPLDAVDSKGWNALSHAMDNHRLPMAALLLAKGIDCAPLEKVHYLELADFLVTTGNLEGLQAVAKTVEVAKTVDGRQNTLLIQAARAGNLDMVKWLLAEGAEVNHKNMSGESAWSVAVGSDFAIPSRPLLVVLLKAGADFRVGPGAYGSRMAEAIDSNDLALLNAFLDRGAEATTKANPFSGQTLLGRAILKRRPALIALLIEKGASPDGGSQYGTDLSLACIMGDTVTAKELIRLKADVNRAVVAAPLGFILADTYEDQAMDLLSHTSPAPVDSSGRNRMVFLLVEAGADVNAPGLKGAPPVSSAAARNRMETVRYLVEQGARVDASDPWGLTPIMHGARSLAITDFFLSKGASITAADRSGRTPLLHGLWYGDSLVVQSLLAAGSSLAVRDIDGNGVVFYDVCYNWTEANTLRRLAALGADVNARDNRLSTPLIAAATRGLYDKAVALVENKAEVNAADDTGVTALMMAILNNQNPRAMDLVKYLIAQGADVNARLKDGRTVLNIANSTYKQAFIDVVKAAGAL